jgi:hypothetical protein
MQLLGAICVSIYMIVYLMAKDLVDGVVGGVVDASR